MRHDDGDEERRRCGLCGKVLRPYDSISVTDVGERCYRCFNAELADRLGIAFDNTSYLSPDRRAPSGSRRTAAGLDGDRRVSDRDHTKTIVAEQTKRKRWSDVRARLQAFDRKGLVSLLGDLYDASVANRRFLHSRLTPGGRAIEEYRRLVADAIYPDPFSRRRVSLRDAAAAIVEYRRSTGDASGTVDLMLTFVEAGTEQAADLGYGDETYFNALQIRLDAVAKEFDVLPADVRANVRTRLGRIQVRARDVGWGFSDVVDELVHALDARPARGRLGKVDRR